MMNLPTTCPWACGGTLPGKSPSKLPLSNKQLDTFPVIPPNLFSTFPDNLSVMEYFSL